MSNKQTEKKIIGYTIKKGFEKYLIPAAKIGNTSVEQFNSNQVRYGWMFGYESVCSSLLKDGDLVNEWFDPVYEPEKPKSITVVVGNPKLKIEIFKDKLISQGRTFTKEEFQKIYNFFFDSKSDGIGPNLNYAYITEVQFGCESEGTKLRKEDFKLIDEIFEKFLDEQ